ncbi:hypothetical protein LEP1GSC070_1345 [Leptospira santarosai str. AIM]|nr:hypothetical protein LEP1GSC070_1345 [Leptospira santarosai str. AIM]EPG83813.1 hypothetical protein LEP1GSC048_3215 [Leptospira santarosai serovar Shermani str. 1342KT]
MDARLRNGESDHRQIYEYNSEFDVRESEFFLYVGTPPRV